MILKFPGGLPRSADSSIRPTGGSTGRIPSLQRRAIRSFLNATAQEIRTYPIGNGFGLDLSRESCILCAGFFPKTGEVQGWYTDNVLVYSHVGCATFDIRHWDKDLEPDHGVVRACSCVDGCGRCGGAGDLGPVGCVSHRGDPDMAHCAACREVEQE